MLYLKRGKWSNLSRGFHSGNYFSFFFVWAKAIFVKVLFGKQDFSNLLVEEGEEYSQFETHDANLYESAESATLINFF